MLLGINSYSNNAGMATYDGGHVGVVLEEERFDRKKKSHDFPHRALSEAFPDGLPGDEVEAVCFPWNPRYFTINYLKILAAELPRSLQLLLPASSREDNSMIPVKSKLSLPRAVKKHVHGKQPPVHYVAHHDAHAACAFFSSPFDDALILIADAFGDECSISAYVGRDNQIEQVYKNRLVASLGVLYSCVTLYLGYKTVLDEGKVMALASYGTDAYVDQFDDIVQLKSDGTVDLDWSWINFHRAGEIKPFTKKFEQAFGPPRKPGEPMEQRHKDLARALQKRTEDALLHLARSLREKHGMRNLAFAGGVAMNCVSAGRMARECGFDDTFVPANPDDGGTPLGAAMWHAHNTLGRPRGESVSSASQGLEFGEERIKRALGGRDHVVVDDPAEEAAALIAAGRTVGWFQGRMEIGPRALGNRSLLADPRDPKMQDHLNSNVKHREPYRPYAPSVLDDAVAEWYPDSPYSPFMSFTSKVAPEHAGDVPAVTHVDGTARVQSVREDIAPEYHRLISAFARRTGVPLVLNTSLNDREPICATPDDALRCFDGTELDALIMERYMVLRPGVTRPETAEAGQSVQQS